MSLFSAVFAVALLLPSGWQGTTAPSRLQPGISFGAVKGWPGDEVFVPLFLTAAEGPKIRRVSFELRVPAPDLTFDQLEPSIATRQSGAKIKATPEQSTVRVSITADGPAPLREELLASVKLTISRSVAAAGPRVVAVSHIEVEDVNGTVHALPDMEFKVEVDSPETRPVGMCFFYMH